MLLTVKTNFPDVERALSRLRADVQNKALSSAINKTMDFASTTMVRQITSEFNVKAAYVRERLRIRRAVSLGSGSLTAALIGGKSDRGRSANIIAFVENKVTLAEGRRRAKAGTQRSLFVKVKRASAPRALKGAFIGNKGRTVFRRTGKERLPIEPVQVIDVAQIFNTKRINTQVVQAITKRFPVIAEREIRFFVDRFNRGGR